jgi:hypothetical protein
MPSDMNVIQKEAERKLKLKIHVQKFHEYVI